MGGWSRTEVTLHCSLSHLHCSRTRRRPLSRTEETYLAVGPFLDPGKLRLQRWKRLREGLWVDLHPSLAQKKEG